MRLISNRTKHTGDILITTKWSNDSLPIGESDFIVGVGREQSLEESNRRVEYNGAFDPSLDANLDLVVVD